MLKRQCEVTNLEWWSTGGDPHTAFDTLWQHKHWFAAWVSAHVQSKYRQVPEQLIVLPDLTMLDVLNHASLFC